MWIRQFVAVVTGGILICAPAIWAQTGDTEEVSQQTTSAEQTGQAAGQALAILELDSGPPVTYADVLRNPDDILLNLRFARAQVNEGNVRGAVATLERVLLIDPDLAQVRLFYAVILFRLESLDEAEKEFNAVAALDIPADVRAEVELYLGRIALERRLTRYSASLAFGAHYDTNRDFTPTSETRLAGGVPFTVSNKSDDVGYLAIGSIRVDHDLGYQAEHEVFGSLTYYHDEQDEQDTQDLQSFTAGVGGVYGSAFEGVDVISSLFYSHLRLSKETFFQEVGGNLRFERRLAPGIEGFADFGLTTQTFSSIRENTTSNERDGREASGMIGATWQVAPAHILSGDFQHYDKSAKGAGGAEFFSFYRDQLRLSHTWLMGGGQFLLSNFTFQRDRYEDSDPSVANITRQDETYRVRVTYGAPLSYIFGNDLLWEELEDITFSPSMESLHTNSNLVNFEVTNYKLQAMLTKTWRF